MPISRRHCWYDADAVAPLTPACARHNVARLSEKRMHGVPAAALNAAVKFYMTTAGRLLAPVYRKSSQTDTAQGGSGGGGGGTYALCPSALCSGPCMPALCTAATPCICSSCDPCAPKAGAPAAPATGPRGPGAPCSSSGASYPGPKSMPMNSPSPAASGAEALLGCSPRPGPPAAAAAATPFPAAAPASRGPAPAGGRRRPPPPPPPRPPSSGLRKRRSSAFQRACARAHKRGLRFRLVSAGPRLPAHLRQGSWRGLWLQ